MIKMCTVKEPRRTIKCDHLVAKEKANNEERMGTKEKFINRVLQRLPLNEVAEELVSLGRITCPVIMTTLLLYSRSIISMLFLGHLGELELAGGALAIAFGNVTGISVLKGLAVGMDPICCQAYGAKRWSVLSQTYQKTLILLLLTTIPITFLWLNIEPIFLKLGQDPGITHIAKIYMVFCIPELLSQAHLIPLRTFLRTQGIATPLIVAATFALIFHFPVNYFLAVYLDLGVKGIALASAWSTFNLNVGLVLYVVFSKNPLKPWSGAGSFSIFQGWKPLLALALPSACSVCLEWWWYEIMLFLSGLLKNPQANVAAMGILIQTTGILYIFPVSLSSGLATRVGHALGAGQPSRAQVTAVIGLILAAGFGFSAFVLTNVVRDVWGKLFTGESQTLDVISAALPVLGLCEIGNWPQTAACGVLTGSARPTVGARINLFAFYLVGLPVAVLLGFTFKVGFLGLWFGLAAAQGTCLCMMVYTLFRTDWMHQVKRAEELTLAAGEKEDLEASLVSDET